MTSLPWIQPLLLIALLAGVHERTRGNCATIKFDMPYRQADASCLNCDNAAMSQVTNQGISYRRCEGCQSVWMGRNESQSLMKMHDPEGDSELLVGFFG